LIILAGCGRFGFGAPDAAIDELVPSCAGHDEDGDAFPDACDVCPTVVDATQRDGDGDGVGDACDPRPAITGDYILRFEPHDDAATAQYMPFNTVEWRPDTVRLGALADAGSVYYVLDAYPSRLAVTAHIVNASTQPQWFGFWYTQNTAANDPKVFASAARTPPDPVAFSLKEQTAPNQERLCADAAIGPAAFVPGDSYTILVDTSLVTAGDDHIVFSSSAQSWECHLAVAIPRSTAGFLEANRMIVDFDYFIAYGVR
jgi:hypothetical protein